MNGKIMLNGKAYSSSGRPSKEITYAQWLALPDAKYTDGIVYYIKDIGGANQFPPLIYSDEEREVGVWRNGKPLYQKSITILPSILQPADNDLPISLPNMETFVRGFGTLKRSNGWGVAIPNSYGSTDWNIGIFNVRENMFDFWIGSSALRTASVVYITFQYTKTTDTAGSGTWTTDGTYAKHYSTEEKVIGTWIDGKPLYEKTFVLQSSQTIAKSAWVSVNIDLTNVKAIIDKRFINSSDGANTGGGSIVLKSNNQLLVGNEQGYDTMRFDTIILQYTKTTD